MSRFLETDIREQQMYEKRIQTSVSNTVNNLRHEIKLQNHVKNKNIYCFIIEKVFFKIPKNSFTSAFFAKEYTKNTDMPRQIRGIWQMNFERCIS